MEQQEEGIGLWVIILAAIEKDLPDSILQVSHLIDEIL